MKSTTRKLSGIAMERMFLRVMMAEKGVDAATAERLARRLALAITSTRVRRVPLKALKKPATPVLAEAPPSLPEAPLADRAAPPALAPSPPVEAPFDPYAFGLVPVYQREGRDGLAAKLAAVAATAHLRAMAKAQQIALAAELRTGDVPAAVLRDAIVVAVEKRIADRRAAAS